MAETLRSLLIRHEWQNRLRAYENCQTSVAAMLKTVACVVQDGFAPFEFGLACEAFGLDRSNDGVPSFDFRVIAPHPGVVQSKLGFSINV